MSSTVKYPTEVMRVEEDAKAIAKYVRQLNDPRTDEVQAKELAFRLGLRLMRMQTELANIGEFVDLVTGKAE